MNMEKILTLKAAAARTTGIRNSPEFKAFARAFKSEIKKDLESKGCKLTDFNTGHFYVSGFFRNKFNACYYFSLSDVRFFDNNKLLVRTAENEKDYTGGMNEYVFFDQL